MSEPHHIVVSSRFNGPAGFCPVQTWGVITTDDGVERYVYFRARGSRWQFEVYPGGRMPLPHSPDDLPDCEPEWWIERRYGEGYAAGWMPEADATELLNWALGLWVAGVPSCDVADVPPVDHDLTRTELQLQDDRDAAVKIRETHARATRRQEEDG